MEPQLEYSDITLIPNYSACRTRSVLDTQVVLNGHIFRSPIIPANMKCSIAPANAFSLARNKDFYIMHRFDSIEDRTNFIVFMNQQNLLVSISVGVTQAEKDFVKSIANHKIDFITIDIAHGHSEIMKEMIDFIKKTFKKNKHKPFIIAGNITTPRAAFDLLQWGADGIKVGIGGGGACSTKNKTGFTLGMFSAVKEICDALKTTDNSDLCQYSGEPSGNKKIRHKCLVIADGGIRENGDVVKAIVAGADMVMAGSWFTKLVDSPAETTFDTLFKEQLVTKTQFGSGVEYQSVEQIPYKKYYKEYYGSASQFNKGEYKHVEGIKVRLPMDENNFNYEFAIRELIQDLQSAISYAGGTKLRDLDHVQYRTKN